MEKKYNDDTQQHKTVIKKKKANTHTFCTV